MGACLSCLGIRPSSSSPENRRLLDDSYPSYANSYQPIAPPNALSPEEQRVEREALDNITRWASDQIIEIFPHGQALQASAVKGVAVNGMSASGVSDGASEDGEGGKGVFNGQTHHDILLSMIPGDKSKRGIRIYPASRPGSRSASTNKDAGSLRSKGSSSGINGKEKAGGIFVKLDVDVP